MIFASKIFGAVFDEKEMFVQTAQNHYDNYFLPKDLKERDFLCFSGVK